MSKLLIKKSYGLDWDPVTKDEPERKNILDEPGPGLQENPNPSNQLAEATSIREAGDFNNTDYQYMDTYRYSSKLFNRRSFKKGNREK